jgi:hypothetical protein
MVARVVLTRHCERSEAIQLYRSKAGLLRRFAPRNDEPKHLSRSQNSRLIDGNASVIIEL